MNSNNSKLTDKELLQEMETGILNEDSKITLKNAMREALKQYGDFANYYYMGYIGALKICLTFSYVADEARKRGIKLSSSLKYYTKTFEETLGAAIRENRREKAGMN